MRGAQGEESQEGTLEQTGDIAEGGPSVGASEEPRSTTQEAAVEETVPVAVGPVATSDHLERDVESQSEELRKVFVAPSGVVHHTRRECGKLKSARKVTTFSACPTCSRCPSGGRNVSVDGEIYHLDGMQCPYASQFKPYRPCAECGRR